MSPHLHAEIISADQREIPASPVDPDELQEPQDTGHVPHHSARCRARGVVTRAAAGAGICLAVATIVATDGPTATASSSPAQVATIQTLSPTARHLQPSIRALESKGYVEKACTTKGILMSNPLTGRVTTITY